MFIEEVLLDGFKSYAQRTVVPNFDPFFNAITGLNGSGKSNILDSICFVLGITNLSQARSVCTVLRVSCRAFERQTHQPLPLAGAICMTRVRPSRFELAACRSWCTSRDRRA